MMQSATRAARSCAGLLPSTRSAGPSRPVASAAASLVRQRTCAGQHQHQQHQHASLSTSTRRHAAPLASPLNVPKWLSENSHLLQPPINNYCVYNKDVTVMIVGGPNARTDYHINETAEWFYQYKGAMLLKVIDPADNSFRDVVINEGDMFLLPPNVPHNPVRFADTVGIVIEQHRPEDSVDKLRWYCQNCNNKVHEASFHCTDLGTQIKSAVQAFEKNTAARTCKKCGDMCDVKPRQMPKIGA